MAQLFANNAIGYLQSEISNSATTITLQTNQGTLFPTISSASDYFLVTLYSKNNGVEYNHEIVKVTARTGDILTVSRAQESTTARTWVIGTPVEARITKSTLQTASITQLFATPPVTISAATYTVGSTDFSLIFSTTNNTLTLPTASSNSGKILIVRNSGAISVTSNATNVVPITSSTAGSAILAATSGKFAILQSNGTNWVILASN